MVLAPYGDSIVGRLIIGNLMILQGASYTRQVQELKGDVRRSFVEVVEPLAKLEFINSIGKLGLASFFEGEITEVLDTIMSEKNNPCIKSNLYATALCFRLLRQHGYEVSQGTDAYKLTHYQIK